MAGVVAQTITTRRASIRVPAFDSLVYAMMAMFLGVY